jgi:thiamine biosynthesis lipoprotein
MITPPPHPEWPHHSFRAMGTTIELWLDTDDESAWQAFLLIEELFYDVTRILSRFNPTSELSRLNVQSERWVPVSRTLWDVLDVALDFARDTQGLFDPTVLHSLKAAGYDRSFVEIGSGGKAPPRRAPYQAGQWQDVLMDPERRAVWLPPGVGLDFGGIAKGYTAQWAVQLLSVWGPCLVNAGGDIVAGHAPRTLAGWPVSVGVPRINGAESNADVAFFWLANEALATSGVDHRNWFSTGKPAHHIIDPRTGQPAITDVLTASVIAPTGSAAEVWAKVALILGTEMGVARLSREGLLVMLIDRHQALHLNPPMRKQIVWHEPRALVTTHEHAGAASAV